MYASKWIRPQTLVYMYLEIKWLTLSSKNKLQHNKPAFVCFDSQELNIFLLGAYCYSDKQIEIK